MFQRTFIVKSTILYPRNVTVIFPSTNGRITHIPEVIRYTETVTTGMTNVAVDIRTNLYI